MDIVDTLRHNAPISREHYMHRAADEIERLRHNLQVTEQTKDSYAELAMLRLHEIERLLTKERDELEAKLRRLEEIERLRKQLAANNPLLDEAADKIDELEAKLKFAETTLEEIRNEDANGTINYYCDETLSVIRGK